MELGLNYFDGGPLLGLFEPKKVLIFRAHPFQWPTKSICPHTNHYVPRHINNRYINSYMMWNKKNHQERAQVQYVELQRKGGKGKNEGGFHFFLNQRNGWYMYFSRQVG